MEIKDLSTARLGGESIGYLIAYLRLDGAYDAVITALDLTWSPSQAEEMSEAFNDATMKAKQEVMKLFTQHIEERLCTLDNHTEL